VRSRTSRRGGLAGELAVSVVSGLILVVLGKAAGLASLDRPVPLWALITVTATAASVATVLTLRLRRRREQAFVVISTFAGTTFLTQLLEHLTRALEHHGIDLVVRLPRHDHSGRSLREELASLSRQGGAYIGGFVVPDHLETLRDQFVQFSRGLNRPVVFLDRRPFPDPLLYPAGAVFVGSDPSEIGKLAADWTAKELADRNVSSPTVLVIGGDGQAERQKRFEARLLERSPSARIEVDNTGQFDRGRAREIVEGHLGRMHRRGVKLDAVFCTNDEMALGAADALWVHAKAGGAESDAVVVGVDGNAHAVAAIRAGTSALRATVVQDPRRVAEVAVDQLLGLRAHQPVPAETFTTLTVYPLP
jgi:ribose transport system substrate-binding protein